jgi:hypothetical protein
MACFTNDKPLNENTLAKVLSNYPKADYKFNPAWLRRGKGCKEKLILYKKNKKFFTLSAPLSAGFKCFISRSLGYIA